MTNLSWTAHRPTEPGWYWVRPLDNKGSWHINYYDADWVEEVSHFVFPPHHEWAGPLVPPGNPESPSQPPSDPGNPVAYVAQHHEL